MHAATRDGAEGSKGGTVRRNQVVAIFAALWGLASLSFLIWSLVRHLTRGTADFTFAIFAIFPFFAFAAAVAELRERPRLAGVFLVLSAASVMGFAYIGSVLALAVGLAEIIAGRAPTNARTP